MDFTARGTQMTQPDLDIVINLEEVYNYSFAQL